jgi:hypothetical protein
MIRYTRVSTPLGALLIAADERGLVSASLSTPSEKISTPPGWKKDSAFFAKAEKAVRDFFEKGKPLPRLPKGALLARKGGSPFQLKVWAAIEAIPFGRGARRGHGLRVEPPDALHALPPRARRARGHRRLRVLRDRRQEKALAARRFVGLNRTERNETLCVSKDGTG